MPQKHNRATKIQQIQPQNPAKIHHSVRDESLGESSLRVGEKTPSKNTPNLADFDILVGKCGRTIGLSGALNLIIYSDFAEGFRAGDSLRCGGRILKIERINLQKPSVKFFEIGDIDAAKALNNENLYITKQQSRESCALKSGEFFWFDIVGMAVLEEGANLGTIANIERIGALDYLIVQTNVAAVANLAGFSGAKIAKTFMIPFIPRYVLETSLESRTVRTKDALGILENS